MEKSVNMVLLLLPHRLMSCFCASVGPVPWAVNSELYPIEIRGFATGIASAANWTMNAVVAQTFLSCMYYFGGSGTFWMYSGIACLGWIWAWVFLPETKGLSLDEVQGIFWSRVRR